MENIFCLIKSSLRCVKQQLCQVQHIDPTRNDIVASSATLAQH